MKKDKNELIKLWNKVAENFGKSGPKYWDRFGERLVELSDVKKGNNVLDIGMGRGSSLFPAAKKIGITGKAIGIDLSEVMVMKTQQKIIEYNLKNVEVFQLDAEELEFSDACFDNIIFGFGIGHIVNEDKNVKNVLRMLKENGQLSLSLWGIQKDQKWLTDIVEQFLPPKNTEKNDSKRNSNLQLNTVENVIDFLESFNLKEIEVIEENNEVVYRDKDQWWKEMWNNAVRNIIERIEKMGEDKFKEFQCKVNEGLQSFESEKGISFNMKVIYAFGKKY
jgi:ubiquinone/menaquinone biosynthesis C-methylase UbiE